MIKAVVFDLDGTLVDSQDDLAHAVNAALHSVGLPGRTVEEIRGFIGEGSRRLLEQAVGANLEKLETAHAAWERAYAANLLQHTRLYPAVEPLLRALAARLPGKLVVHTNKPGHFARAILRGLEVDQLFSRVLGSGDGPARKPDPEGALVLLEGLGVEPHEAAYVGDSSTDVRTAHAAGVPFLGVDWGYGGETVLRAAGAEKIARKVIHLRRWIEAE